MRRLKTVPIVTKVENDTITLNLPYHGNNGHNILTKMKKDVSKAIKKGENETSIRIVYNARKLGSRFAVKDKPKGQHVHNVVYSAKCPNKKCKSEYIGQTKCRVGKRATEHNRTDRNSHLLKHAKKHPSQESMANGLQGNRTGIQK